MKTFIYGLIIEFIWMQRFIRPRRMDDLTSKTNKDLEDDDNQFRFSNGVSIRRARFGVKATLYKKWFAELDLDFAYNEVEIKDMYLGYKFNNHFLCKGGKF